MGRIIKAEKKGLSGVEGKKKRGVEWKGKERKGKREGKGRRRGLRGGERAWEGGENGKGERADKSSLGETRRRLTGYWPGLMSERKKERCSLARRCGIEVAALSYGGGGVCEQVSRWVDACLLRPCGKKGRGQRGGEALRVWQGRTLQCMSRLCRQAPERKQRTASRHLYVTHDYAGNGLRKEARRLVWSLLVKDDDSAFQPRLH